MGDAQRPGQAIRDYKDLQVWQKAMDLAKRVYQLTQSFAAAVPVPSNIAEGQARRTTGQFIQFIRTPKDRWLSWTRNAGCRWRWTFVANWKAKQSAG